MSDEITKNKIFSNLLWKYAESIGAKAVAFVVSIVLARLLEPNVYGTIAISSAFISLLYVFVDSGFGVALIQKKDADEIDFSSVFYFNLIISGILYIILFILAPYIAFFYNNPELTYIIRVLSISVIVFGIKNIQHAYVAKNMMFKKFFFSTLGGTIGAAIIGISMAYNGYGVWALVAQMVFNNIVDTLILWITVKWRPIKVFSLKRLKTLLAFGFKLLISSLLETCFNQARTFIIGKKYTSESLAYYNKGESWPNLIVMSINASIDSILLPSMSLSQDKLDSLKSMTRRAIKLGSYILLPLMIGMLSCADNLVVVVLTEKWSPIIPYLRIFCLVYAFYPIHTSNLNTIKALGESSIYLKLEVLKKIVGVIIIAVSMWYGVWVMACSALLGNAISIVINSYPNGKLINYGFFEQMKDIFPELIASGIMGGIVFGVGMIGINSIVLLLIQVTVGICVYVCISYIFKMESFYYILDILKSKRA